MPFSLHRRTLLKSTVGAALGPLAPHGWPPFETTVRMDEVVMAGFDASNSGTTRSALPQGQPKVGEPVLPEWQFMAPESGGPMLARAGMLHATAFRDSEPTLLAIDAMTGDLHWTSTDIGRLLALGDGTVIGTAALDPSGQTVIALDAETGSRQIWSAALPTGGRAAVVEGALITAGALGIASVAIADGAERWVRMFDEGLGHSVQVAIAAGVVVGTCPTTDIPITAWDLATGEPSWEVAFDHLVQTQPVATGDGVLLCGPQDLIELDIRTGEEIARSPLGIVLPYLGRLLVTRDTIVVSGIDGLALIDRASREVRGVYRPYYGTAFQVMATETHALLLTDTSLEYDSGSVVEAIDLVSGEPVFESPRRGTPGADHTVRQVLLANGRLYLATETGLLIAEDSGEPWAGITTPIDGTTFLGTGFHYSWDEHWDPQGSAGLGGEDSQVLTAEDGSTVVQYVDAREPGMTPAEAARYLTGAAEGGEVSFEPAPLASQFPLVFGPDTRYLRSLRGVPAPDLPAVAPPGTGAAMVLVETTFDAPFDTMLVLVLAVPLDDADRLLIFEVATAESRFDGALDAFGAILETVVIA